MRTYTSWDAVQRVITLLISAMEPLARLTDAISRL
jgi:hypothetical protein